MSGAGILKSGLEPAEGAEPRMSSQGLEHVQHDMPFNSSVAARVSGFRDPSSRRDARPG